MKGRMITSAWLIGYSLLIGLMLALFAVIDGVYRYAFSLLALFVGIHFFRKFETLSLRITFAVVSFIMYVLLTVIVTAILFLRDNP